MEAFFKVHWDSNTALWVFYYLWHRYGHSAHPRDDDSGDRNLDAGVLEQLVAEVNAVPEADDVALDGDVVLSVKPEMTNVGELVAVYS